MFVLAMLGVMVTVLFETAQQLAFKRASKTDRTDLVWMVIGAAIYLPQQLCWVYTLSLLPLAMAAPLLGASYITVPLASGLVFGEKLNREGWIGIALIVTGIALIARELPS